MTEYPETSKAAQVGTHFELLRKFEDKKFDSCHQFNQHFTYEHFVRPLFFYVHVTRKKAAEKMFVQKTRAKKMLMKLTLGVNPLIFFYVCFIWLPLFSFLILHIELPRTGYRNRSGHFFETIRMGAEARGD